MIGRSNCFGFGFSTENHSNYQLRYFVSSVWTPKSNAKKRFCKIYHIEYNGVNTECAKIDFEKSVGTIFDDKVHFKEVVVA